MRSTWAAVPARPHRQQPGFRLRGRHAGQGTHLGVGQVPARQGLRQAWQRRQRARDPDALPRGAEVEPHAPGEPVRARAEAGIPAAARVELPDESEQAGGRRLQVGRELGDLIA